MKCETQNIQHVASLGQRKKSECPTGIKPMTSQTLVRHSIHRAKRTHDEQGRLLGLYVTTYILLGLAVSIVPCVMINKERWLPF